MIHDQFWDMFMFYILVRNVRNSSSMIFIEISNGFTEQEKLQASYNASVNDNGARINKQNNKVEKWKKLWKTPIVLLHDFCSDTLCLNFA